MPRKKTGTYVGLLDVLYVDEIGWSTGHFEHCVQVFNVTAIHCNNRG